MASIVDPEPDSKKAHPPTLEGAADAMLETGDALTHEVAFLISAIGLQHQEPVTCAQCRDGEFMPCQMLEQANCIAIAWLMQRAGI